jgi:prolyl-tRNA editing enzyme YbaK/EbsC (Cys-tRNA(Pro) deacylase)
MHPRSAAVDEALMAAGAAGRVRLLPEAAPTAVTAAKQLGVEVGAIVNSLVFLTAEGAPLLVLTSGAHRVDTARVAGLVGTATISRAPAETVLSSTGQHIGGVAPLGHPQPLRTLVDRDLAQYGQIWAAGGIAHAVFPTTFAELVRITGGTPADVA